MLDKAQRMYPFPPYAPFPRSEFAHRIQRLKEEMEAAKLDAIVMWGENNIRYFTGFLTNHFPPVTVCPAVLLVAVDKDPVIIVPNFFQGVVEGFTFDSRGLHLDVDVERLDPLVAWTLHVCRGALEGSAKTPRERTALFLANLSLPSIGAVRATAAPQLRNSGGRGLLEPFKQY